MEVGVNNCFLELEAVEIHSDYKELNKSKTTHVSCIFNSYYYFKVYHVHYKQASSSD